MPMTEAKDTLKNGWLVFGNYLELNGYGRGTGGRQKMAKELGVTVQYISKLVNGQEHGRAAFDNVNKLFKYTGYTGENWVIH
jgi:transcriptional regulator with XRE-family HTH domain